MPSARCGGYIFPASLLTRSGNLSSNMSINSYARDWSGNCKLQFHRHHSYFRKKNLDAVSNQDRPSIVSVSCTRSNLGKLKQKEKINPKVCGNWTLKLPYSISFKYWISDTFYFTAILVKWNSFTFKYCDFNKFSGDLENIIIYTRWNFQNEMIV